MNFSWKKQMDKGQDLIGYIEIYETRAEGIPIRIIINYFPELKQFQSEKICSVTVLYACSKNNITKSFFHSLNTDVLELIQKEEKAKFSKSKKKFHMMMTQHFVVKELPQTDYLSHGDYSISD